MNQNQRKRGKDQHALAQRHGVQALDVLLQALVHGVPTAPAGGASATCKGADRENSMKACGSVAGVALPPLSACGAATALSFISVTLRPRMIGSLLSARRKAGIKSARSARPWTCSSPPASATVTAVSHTPGTACRPSAPKNSAKPAVLPD